MGDQLRNPASAVTLLGFRHGFDDHSRLMLPPTEVSDLGFDTFYNPFYFQQCIMSGSLLQAPIFHNHCHGPGRYVSHSALLHLIRLTAHVLFM